MGVSEYFFTPKNWLGGAWSVLYLSRQTTASTTKPHDSVSVFFLHGCLENHQFWGNTSSNGSFFPASYVSLSLLAHLSPPRLDLGSQHWHQKRRAANVAMVIRTVDERFAAMLPQWPLHWEQCWRTWTHLANGPWKKKFELYFPC